MMMTFVSLLWNPCLFSFYASWTPTPVPDDQCFEAIKDGVDALPAGTKMLLNSGMHLFSLTIG